MEALKRSVAEAQDRKKATTAAKKKPAAAKTQRPRRTPARKSA